MRAIVTSLTFVLIAASAMAQQPGGAAQTMKLFASSSDVAALQAKAKTDLKEGQPMVAERILSLAPYNINLEYRPGIAPASIHEKEAELFYVIDGSGTFITGGKLLNEKRTNAANLSGTGLEGGSPRDVAKGDFWIVAENVPHWFSKVNGSITVMTFHVPHPVSAEH